MQVWIQLTACCVLFATVECLHITNCPTDGEAVKDRDFYLNCANYSGTTLLTWSFQPTGGGPTTIGTCDGTGMCSPSNPAFSSFFNISGYNSSSSRLTITNGITNTLGRTDEYICATSTPTTMRDSCTVTIVEPPTTTTVATTEATTSGPSPKPDCSLCQFSGCRDTGGCWGCIVLICVIVVITIACLCCWIFYCFCRHQCACCESCFSCLDSLFKSCCGIQGGQGNRPSPDGGDKPDPGATLESLPPHSNGTELTSTPGKPPEPSGKSPGKKRSRRAAENSEMSPERVNDPSLEHDVKSSSPPAKTSRDLPQPNVAKEPNSKAPSVVLSPLTNTTTPPTLPSVEKTSFRKLPLPDIGNAKI